MFLTLYSNLLRQAKLNYQQAMLAIQVKDTYAANRVISNCNCLLFGGSTAKKPIHRNTLNIHCVMMNKCSQRQQHSGHLKRMQKLFIPQQLLRDSPKKAKQLRMLKAQFISSSDTQHAVRNGNPFHFVNCHLSEIVRDVIFSIYVLFLYNLKTSLLQ